MNEMVVVRSIGYSCVSVSLVSIYERAGTIYYAFHHFRSKTPLILRKLIAKFTIMSETAVLAGLLCSLGRIFEFLMRLDINM